MTHESLNNAKFLKLYNWDSFFKEEVYKYKKESLEREIKMEKYYLILTFVWCFFNDILSQISFAAYFGFGYTMNLAQALEIMMLFDKIRGPLDRMTRLREEVLNI